jgi:hypothetical protein
MSDMHAFISPSSVLIGLIIPALRPRTECVFNYMTSNILRIFGAFSFGCLGAQGFGALLLCLLLRCLGVFLTGLGLCRMNWYPERASEKTASKEFPGVPNRVVRY